MKRKRRRYEQEAESSERWLVSYADFITLLFAFFTVLYATSEQNMNKAKDFEESVKKYLIKAGVVGTGSNKNSIEKKENFKDVIESPISTFPRTKPNVLPVLTEVEDRIIEAIGQKGIDQVVIDIAPHDYGVKLSLDASKLLASDDVKFNSKFVGLVDAIGDVLKKIDRKVYVEGHASGEIKLNQVSNHWDAAGLRASLFARYLTRKHGIAANKLLVISYGSQKPIFAENGPHEKKNNRLDLLILTEDPPL